MSKPRVVFSPKMKSRIKLETKMAKKKFDVWVTRHHFRGNDIRVSNTSTTEIIRVFGCTVFQHNGSMSGGRFITKKTCLERYGFLPQPATCWNVWTDTKGVVQYQEYPILEKYNGRTYKAKPIASEREYYL